MRPHMLLHGESNAALHYLVPKAGCQQPARTSPHLGTGGPLVSCGSAACHRAVVLAFAAIKCTRPSRQPVEMRHSRHFWSPWPPIIAGRRLILLTNSSLYVQPHAPVASVGVCILHAHEKQVTTIHSISDCVVPVPGLLAGGCIC